MILVLEFLWRIEIDQMLHQELDHTDAMIDLPICPGGYA
ncbi:hypothetical protein AF72_02105 [Xylella taiwanensis]|uniref:Uncharacterized protein n=1 Tax=Xylella taiwanensis TaxID=1444770 RepID=Z9JM87_9GAMM|nr:hypothetical protein AF72_02105 [Xylella taiwanensis]